MGIKLFENKDGSLVEWLGFLNKENVAKEYVHSLAVAHAIDIIAKMISNTEFQVFRKDKKKVEEKFDDLYWRLNIQPNLNENGTYFKYKLACKVLEEQKAIVLINKIPSKMPFLYVADTYDTNNKIMYGKQYINITVADDEDNTFDIKKTYNSDEVIKISFYNEKIVQAVQQYKTEIGKILNITSKKYKKVNTDKWRVMNPRGTNKIKRY